MAARAAIDYRPSLRPYPCQRIAAERRPITVKFCDLDSMHELGQPRQEAEMQNFRWRTVEDNTALTASIIIACGLISRLAFSLFAGINHEGDAIGYLQAASNLYNHGIYSEYEDFRPSFNRSPGYGMFLYLLHFIPFAIIYVTVIVQSILSILATLFLYILLPKVPRRVKFFGALLFACMPFSIFQDFSVATESFSTSLLIVLMCLIAYGRDRLYLYGAFAGVVAGLLILTTETYLLLPIFILIWPL